MSTDGRVLPPAPSPSKIACSDRLELRALPGLPVFAEGDDLPTLLLEALARAGVILCDCDVLVVASKAVSRCEGRFVDLATVDPSNHAREIAEATAKDPRLVELVLRESTDISRVAKGALVVRHKLGFISADAGIDCSNAAQSGLRGTGPFALLLPEDPDASADRIRTRLENSSGTRLGVIISDSLGRPFRLGSQGAAIGLSGVPGLWDRRGERDLGGRILEHTIASVADPIAAAADLVAGQAAEGRAAVHVRGLSFPASHPRASELVRPKDKDLYA